MAGSLRPLLPKLDATPLQEVSELPRKRKAVTLACQRCRTRKIKCDGERPECLPCRDKDVECNYDDDPETTPHANLKRKFRFIEQEQKDLLELYGMLRNRPEPEAHVILQRLRKGDDVQGLLSLIKDGDLVADIRMSGSPVLLQYAHTTEVSLNLHHPNAYPPLPSLKDPKAELGLREKNVMYVDPTEEESVTSQDVKNSKLLDRPHQTYDSRLRRINARQWTHVTESDVVVANLISLFLSWDHTTIRTFDEDLFLEDLATGGRDYCSPLFINSLLAAASLNYAAIDPGLATELGPLFFKEAQDLWEAEQKKPRILHVPTSILLDMWCKSHGMVEIGAQYIGRGLRIAYDLGLFELEPPRSALADPTARAYWKGRMVIAWGIFNWQTIHGLYVKGSTELPNRQPFPILPELLKKRHEERPWVSFPLIRPTQRIHRDLAFKAYSDLFLILYEYIKARQAVTMTTVDEERTHEIQHANELHVKMLAWADALPPEMLRGPESLPMVLDLHMFLHGVVVHIYRPLANPAYPAHEKAREILQASVCQLRRLLFVQRYRFDGPPFNSATIGSVHVLTFAMFEELVKSDGLDAETSFYLILCSQTLKSYGNVFPASHQILHRLIRKARRQSAILPEELNVIFEELEARVERGGQMGAGTLPKYPIDIHFAITNPGGSEVESLVHATYSLELDNDDDSIKGKEREKES